MEFERQGNIVVTGASRGLGLAITGRLLRDGHRVTGVARGLSPEFEALCRERPELAFVPFDLANTDGYHALVKEITERHGEITGLVNNAGIGSRHTLATVHDSELLRLLSVNLAGAMLLTKYACRSMLLARSGRIVQISSIAAETGFSGLSVYGATKAGLVGFTKSLARELAPLGITVNAVLPGYLETEMTSELPAGELEKVKRRSAGQRLAGVGDVAGVVAMLLGEGGGAISGACITVDAGYTV